MQEQEKPPIVSIDSDDVAPIQGVEDGADVQKSARGKGGRNKKVVIGCVLAAIVVAGAGFWSWHETPGFCSTVCHDTMDVFYQTYMSADNAVATDKLGNEVSNSHAMLSVSHASQDLKCLSCHVPSIGQQIGEVAETVTGAASLPLEERGTLQLLQNSDHESASGNGDEFCLNESCHDLTRQQLREKTSDLSFNPHAWQHGEQQCSQCHKSHRASTLICTECHDDAYSILPDGWVDSATGSQIGEAVNL